MRIANSSVSLGSTHLAYESREQELSVRAWRGSRPGTVVRGGKQGIRGAREALLDAVTISGEARQSEKAQAVAQGDTSAVPAGDLKAQVIRLILERMTGRKLCLFPGESVVKHESAQSPEGEGDREESPGEARVGWGVEIDYHEKRLEAERTTFHAEGVIRTADGEEIRFETDLSMSRQFMEENHLSVRMGDAAVKDPLVINYAGKAAELTTTEFQFDIDSDGTEDQISFVGPGSGFLAVDRDGDGVVNNGSELFGPSSGNGFSELAAFDADGDNWIDADDPVYDKLRIWSKDEQGNDVLFALGEQGVGAIYLGAVETPFALKDEAGTLMGQVRSTGVFLGENGTPETVQQVDLSV